MRHTIAYREEVRIEMRDKKKGGKKDKEKI